MTDVAIYDLLDDLPLCTSDTIIFQKKKVKEYSRKNKKRKREREKLKSLSYPTMT